jgi:hypothetical protein
MHDGSSFLSMPFSGLASSLLFAETNSSSSRVSDSLCLHLLELLLEQLFLLFGLDLNPVGSTLRASTNSELALEYL